MLRNLCIFKTKNSKISIRILGGVLIFSSAAGCGGGGGGDYWQALIRNSTDLSTGATLWTCGARHSSEASCLSVSAKNQCAAEYPFTLPINAKYVCVFVQG